MTYRCLFLNPETSKDGRVKAFFSGTPSLLVRPEDPLSHANWEWTYLTAEVVQKCDAKEIVLVFLGATARQYVRYADSGKSVIIETSHPSPRGSLSSRTPFVGSRVFSRINEGLVSLGKETIDWRLT